MKITENDVHNRKTAMNTSVKYWRELLVPSETVSLYFKVSKKIGPKDLVAALRCYDDAGTEISALESLSYSAQYSRHFIYLRSPKETVGDWVKAAVVSKDRILRIEIEILPWSSQFQYAIEDVVHGVWAAESLQSEVSENPINFVAVKGDIS